MVMSILRLFNSFTEHGTFASAQQWQKIVVKGSGAGLPLKKHCYFTNVMNEFSFAADPFIIFISPLLYSEGAYQGLQHCCMN